MNTQNTLKLLQAAQQIQNTNALDADELAFMARLLVQCTLPHSDPGDVKEYGRTNGDYHLVIQPGPRTGVPYGSYPRLVLAWITTEAVRTKSPRLVLGDSLSAFMGELGIIPTGGRWGTVTRLKEQMKRLFAARVAAVYDGPEGYAMDPMQVARRVRLWWHPKRPDQAALWLSEVELDDAFFQAIIERPVPLDMRALRALKRSPLGLDLYTWITYRVSYLKEPTAVTYGMLHEQFGADYSDVKNFARNVKRELRKIQAVWPELRLETPRGRLRLYPCKPHIARQSGSAVSVDKPGG